MIVRETFDIAAPAGYVYDQISDFGDIGYCVAGVQSVTVHNDRESEWKIEQRFGAMARRFRLSATMVEATRPSKVEFVATGQDVNASGRVEIEELEPQASRCSVTLEIDVTGPLAPLVELFAKGPQQALIRQTIGNVRTKLETGAVPAAAVTSGAGPAVPTAYPRSRADRAVPTATAASGAGEFGFFARVRVVLERLFRRARAGDA